MRIDPKPEASEAARPDFALLVAGVRVAQAASPTARAQDRLAAQGAAAPADPNPFTADPAAGATDGSYRRFSEVTNGKRT